MPFVIVIYDNFPSATPHSALRIPDSNQSSALNAREIKSRTACFGLLPS
jgi:hypothetical protein